MFRAPRLHHSNSAHQEPFCPVSVLCPLQNFVMQVVKNFGLILTQPVPYQYYSLHLESGLRLQTLIFTYLKERGITILCLFFRICSSRNQELQTAEQSRKQSSKTKEFSVILQQLLGLPLNKCRLTVWNRLLQLSVLILMAQILWFPLQKPPLELLVITVR